MLSDVLSFQKELDANDFHYQPYEELENSYRSSIGIKGDNTSIRVNLFFDKDGDTVALRVFDFVSAPENKYADTLVLCNTLNSKYRWVKFYIDEDNDVIIEDDALVAGETSGAESLELAMRMVNIADEVYPEFMRTFFA